MARTGIKVTKDSIGAILKDLRLAASGNGKKVIREMGQGMVKTLIERTPQTTGMAASGWLKSAYALRVTPPDIKHGDIKAESARHSRKGRLATDRRKFGERLGRYVEKSSKKLFKLSMINGVQHFWIRGGKQMVGRTMKAARRKFSPLFSKAMRATRTKMKKGT